MFEAFNQYSIKSIPFNRFKKIRKIVSDSFELYAGCVFVNFSSFFLIQISSSQNSVCMLYIAKAWINFIVFFVKFWITILLFSQSYIQPYTQTLSRSLTNFQSSTKILYLLVLNECVSVVSIHGYLLAAAAFVFSSFFLHWWSTELMRKIINLNLFCLFF